MQSMFKLHEKSVNVGLPIDTEHGCIIETIETNGIKWLINAGTLKTALDNIH